MNIDENSYLNLVKTQIESDKLLYNLPKDKQNKIKKLLELRNKIRNSNNFFAEYRINKINKKILKIKNSN